MPVYEFRCDGCGSFEERRSLEEVEQAAYCPGCGTAARRVYSAPNFKTVPAALSKAKDRAEKSAYEPGVVRKPAGGELPGRRFKPGGGHHGHSH